ncbi:MAG: hypothetical protein Q9195_009600 [Heterodermia aff. obscurata]
MDTLDGIPGTQPVGWASSEDWTKHRALLTRLYEEFTLKKVKEIMEDDLGFKATENMYKKRFKQWNARKYNEESEMKAIVRKRAERAKVGKDSAFKVRGRDVDIQEVSRYWERKGIPVDEVVTRRAMSPTPEAVKCFTPLQSPLRTPEVLATTERILVTLQNYIRGSFDAGKWRHPRGAESLSLYYDQCNLARYLFNCNRCLEAWQALNSAFACINTILRAEHVDTFRSILHTSMMFQISKPEIGFAMLRQVSAMAEVVLGSSHPLKFVCTWLASLGQKNKDLYQDISSISLQKAAECFEQILGPTHAETICCGLFLIRDMKADIDLKIKERKLRQLLRDCETSLSELTNWTFLVRRDLALNLYMQRNFVLAREEFQCLLSRLPSSDRSSLKADSLYYSAFCQYELGDTQGAVATLRKTIDLVLSGHLESEHGTKCMLMLTLENWLSELGEFDSAAQLQETRLKLQDSMRVEYL